MNGDKLQMAMNSRHDLVYYVQKRCEEAYNKGFALGKTIKENEETTPEEVTNNNTINKIVGLLEGQMEMLQATGNESGAKILQVAANTVMRELMLTPDQPFGECCEDACGSYEEVL